MANSAQARKRARQSENSRRRNAGQRSMTRTYIKRVVNAIEGGNAETAAAALKEATPIIDSAARKGLMHANKAARHKSRLNQRIKALSAG